MSHLLTKDDSSVKTKDGIHKEGDTTFFEAESVKSHGASCFMTC